MNGDMASAFSWEHQGHVTEETVLGTGQQAYGEMGPDREET